MEEAQSSPRRDAGADPFAALTWRHIGPWRGGRVMAVAGHPADPSVWYFGSTGGGVWRSGDTGTTWRNVSDGYFRRATVGAIALAPSDPDIIYVGMGEGSLRNNVTGGDGIYRSRDGGATWSHLGLAATQNIARLRVDPRDPNRVYVAACGHRFGLNPERGIYRSTDGGGTWDRVLFVDERSGAIDVSLDQRNPRYLYAATWDALRTPWGFTSGGPGSGIWRSRDGGDTWDPLASATRRAPGLPGGTLGHIAVAVSPADSRRVYALIEAAEGGGLYRSGDRGETWTWISDEPQLLVRPWYLGHLVADPCDPDTLYVPGRKLWKSRDGGRSWAQLNTTYWDQQDLWVDPRDTRRMILGNDGGAAISTDGGTTWSSVLNQPTAELYHVAVDRRFPYRVYGAQQDNSTISLPVRSARGPVSQADWYDVGGGESGHIAIRPDKPDIVYAASYAGEITRYDHATGDIRTISVWPEDSTGWGAGDVRHRFNWSTPVVLSPHDPDTLYVAGERLFRSTDEGASWEAISPDLSRNDPAKQGRAGGPITYDSAGTDYYGTILAFAESPVSPGLLWAGTDDGLVHLSRDGGATWADVTPPGIPEWAGIATVEPSPHAADAAYIAATAHRFDDFRPLLFKTTDAGQSWTPIAAGIPGDEFCRTIRADPDRPGLLYAGSEATVYASHDDGASWRPLGRNLPVTPIYDLAVHQGDLIAATHGRGFWVLDDLSPLHQLAAERDDPASAGSPPPRLLMPRPIVRVAREAYSISSLIALGYPYGSDGPPFGAYIHYFLPEPPGDDLLLTILDPAGQPIVEFTSAMSPTSPTPLGPLSHRLRGAAATLATRASDEAEPGVRAGVLPPEMQARPADGSRLPAAVGLNRFIWNLRYPGARTLPGHSPGGITAPLAPPGRYGARLSIGDWSDVVHFDILPDPRLATTPADYAAQFVLLAGLRDTVSAIHDAVDAAQDRRRQIADRLTRLADAGANLPLRELLGEYDAALAAGEAALIQPRLHDRAGEQEALNSPVGLDAKLATLGYWLAKSDSAPTRQAEQVYADLASRAGRGLDALRTLLRARGDEVNVLLSEAGQPPLAARP